MNTRTNCFDIIRHFAALLVLFSHHHALSGLREPTLPQWETFGFVAVVIFFSISGYLMPGSFNHSENALVFMAKRCRRIFPGLIVCSLLMCYVIGPLFTSEPILEYLFSASTFKNSLMCSTFLPQQIPGVFSDFIYKNAINGSTWTLPVEFAWYLILAIALYYANNVKMILSLFIFSCVIAQLLSLTGLNYSFYAVPLNYLSIFGIAFTTGALMSMTKSSWLPFRWYLALIALVFLVTLQGRHEILILGPLSLAVLTIIIGVSFKDRWINGRFDLSYGIYIYAFPIQQMVINLVIQSFWPSLLISLMLTLVAAYFSYYFVEKPFLSGTWIRRKTYALGEHSL